MADPRQTPIEPEVWTPLVRRPMTQAPNQPAVSAAQRQQLVASDPEWFPPARRSGSSSGAGTSASTATSGGGRTIGPGTPGAARPANIAPLPESVAQSRWGEWHTMTARAVNGLLRGKMNATATLTLTPNATSTVLTDARIGKYSHVTLEPSSASAAAAVASGQLYPVPGSGKATVFHPSSGAGDQTFSVLIVG